ncbi:serpin family protein [Micromonospora sp. KLBMP9576]|uniref:serpin family protein n=1 Tax=Micromonospora sp. KLBMP9576 TaxID=3424769 RepID=UPI003D8BB67C
MTTDISAAVAQYADRLHAAIGDSHHVASPLGAWLLLALAAPAATGPTRAAMEKALGTDAATAAKATHALLAQPHPLVRAATAFWQRQPGSRTARLDRWLAALPGSTTTGPLPEQAELDAWAREHTLGLIKEFPIAVAPQTLLILANALATRVSWAEPFRVASADALGSGSPWAGGLRRVLRSPEHNHRCWIADTEWAGTVAVHAAPARPAVTDRGAGLLVVSVAAAPDVPAGYVLAAAHEVATAAADAPERDLPTRRRSLFRIPLGESPLWTLREEHIFTDAPDGREERLTAVLPCWSAGSRHDLMGRGLGFAAAAEAFGELLGSPELGFEAVQQAMARYGRYGFEAAAVTVLHAAVSLPPPGVARIAELRFGHPYAVVAVATDSRGGGDVPGPWHGMPVFSAWVAEPEELPEADVAGRRDIG